MNAPDLFDAEGNPFPDRRKSSRREEDDMRDDALDPAILLGYEQWAGRVWRHRGKIAVAIGLVSTAVGCVAGYIGRAGALDAVNTRIAADSSRTNDRLLRLETSQEAQARLEPVKMLMLCSLTRRIDPNGVPPECGPQKATP